MTIISSTTVPILDSAGRPANGRVYIEQSNRYESTAGLVTTTRGWARVTNGVITSQSGGQLSIPATPADQVVWFHEDFTGGTGVVRWATVIPDTAEVGYSDLPETVPPAAGTGVPAWVSDVLTAVDDAETAAASAVAAAAAAEAVGTTNDAIIAGRIADTGSATRASLNATYAALPTRTQAASALSASPVDAGGRYPCWMDRTRTRLFANLRNVLRYSDTDTGTWIDVTSLTLTQEIDAVRDLDNGEVLVTTSPAAKNAPGEVWVSSGFASNPQTATWTKTKTAAASGVYFSNSWSISVHDNIVLLNEYGPKPGGAGNARYCYMSTNYGRTWTTVYDLGTGTGNHLHGVCFDPYWDRIWITYGDDTSGIVYSDNLGETWQVAQSTTDPQGQYQAVGIVALRGCVLFLTDGAPNGVLRIPRTTGRSAGTYTPEVAYQIDASTSLAWLGHLPFRARTAADDAPVLIPFAPELNTGKSRLLATKDGYEFHELWRDTIDTTNRGLIVALGPTARGRLLLISNDGRTANYTKWRGSMPFGY